MLKINKIFENKKGIFFTFISVALISLAPLLHKLGMNHVKPLTAATLWCLFSALFTLMSIKIKQLKISKPHFFTLVKMSATSSLGVLFLFYALSLLEPSTVAFMNRSYTLFIILLGIFVLKEPSSFAQTVLFGLNFVGLLMFSYKGIDNTKYFPLFIVMLSAFSFAFSNMQAKVIVKNIAPCVINFYSHIFSFFILFILTLLMEPQPFSFHTDILYILGSAFSAGFLGMLFYYKGLLHYSFTLSGVIRSFSPVLTTLYALPFFGISYSALNVIGIAFILLSSMPLLTTRVNTSQIKKAA